MIEEGGEGDVVKGRMVMKRKQENEVEEERREEGTEGRRK